MSSLVLGAVVLGAVVAIGTGTLGIAGPRQPTHMAADTHGTGAFVCALQTGPTRLTGPLPDATPQSRAVDAIRASLAAAEPSAEPSGEP